MYLEETKLERAQSWTLRGRLMKIGAKVRITTRTICLSFSESYPYTALLRTVPPRMQAPPASLLAITNLLGDIVLVVRGTDSSLASALAEEMWLRSPDWWSNTSRDRWVMAFVVPFEPERHLMDNSG